MCHVSWTETEQHCSGNVVVFGDQPSLNRAPPWAQERIQCSSCGRLHVHVGRTHSVAVWKWSRSRSRGVSCGRYFAKHRREGHRCVQHTTQHLASACHYRGCPRPWEWISPHSIWTISLPLWWLEWWGIFFRVVLLQHNDLYMGACASIGWIDQAISTVSHWSSTLQQWDLHLWRSGGSHNPHSARCYIHQLQEVLIWVWIWLE